MEDPNVILRHEQSAILSQLRLLEQADKSPVPAGQVLQALVRDSAIYLRREAMYLKCLDEILESGGRSFHHFIQEGDQLQNLLQQLVRQEKSITLPWSSMERGSLDLRGFLTRFRAHLHHVETVLFVLARTRLTVSQQKQLVYQLLAT